MPTITFIMPPLLRRVRIAPPPRSARRARAGAILALLLLVGCGASPPPGRDLRGQEWKSTGAFASLARCTSGIPPCPGSSCAENAVGPSDGKTVDLRACATLDLVFTGGTILSRGGGAD